MTQQSNSERTCHNPFFQNYFCLIEKHETAFVCISKNASTYLKNIAIYAKEGDKGLSENEIHTRVGYSPQNGYLVPISKMSDYEEKYGKLLKFAVWRDPVERLISSYKWFMQEGNWRVYFNWLSLYEDNSFERFLEFVEFELGKSDPMMQDEHIRKQADYYKVLDVDCVVRISELNHFLIQNGIPTLEIQNNQTRKSKVEVTLEQINRIKELYKDDYSLPEHINTVTLESLCVSKAHAVDGSFSNTIGMNGYMGKIISLFSLYQKTREPKWESQAESLLNTVLEKSYRNSPLSYGEGLCGVGYGLEYLLQNHIVEGEADEVLSDIDTLVLNEINRRTLQGLNIDDGILGLAYYLYCRLHYRTESEEKVVLTLKEYVIYLIDWIEEAIWDNSRKSNFYETYFILTLLHKLNIFSSKVEKLQDAVMGLLTLKLTK